MIWKHKKKEKTASTKIIVSEIYSRLLIVAMCVLAYGLIRASLYFHGWWQNLLLSLGTGAAMSALVSFVFYLNDKLIKKRERLNNRIAFMEDFKYFYSNIVNSICFDTQCNTTLNMEAYIKKQHRWYHDYYKRMVAGSATDEETQFRAKQLELFMLLNTAKLHECFEYNTDWKKGAYSDWEYKELFHLYTEFKNIEIYLKQKTYKCAFLEFAHFLERIKRMFTEFKELENFGLLLFVYDENGDLKIERTQFEAKEQYFKFAREFQEIRNRNYVKYYSEEALKGDDNAHT